MELKKTENSEWVYSRVEKDTIYTKNFFFFLNYKLTRIFRIEGGELPRKKKKKNQHKKTSDIKVRLWA